MRGVARIDILEFTALLEAMEAERRTQTQYKNKRKLRSAVGRVLAMAHQLSRDPRPLTGLNALQPSVN